MPKPSVRERLMEAGLQTLQVQGFNGCGVQDITAAAGIPKGSFYNHFQSKEALAVEALDRFWQSGTGRRAVLSDTNLDPVERLRRYFRMLSDGVVQHEFQRGCLIGNFSSELSTHSRPVRDRLTELYAAWARALEACVRDAEAAGRVRPSLPAATVAGFLLNAWEGAVLRSKVEQDRAPLDQFEQVVFASLFT